jgi:hypothetical protein
MSLMMVSALLLQHAEQKACSHLKQVAFVQLHACLVAAL